MYYFTSWKCIFWSIMYHKAHASISASSRLIILRKSLLKWLKLDRNIEFKEYYSFILQTETGAQISQEIFSQWPSIFIRLGLEAIYFIFSSVLSQTDSIS